MTTTPGWMVEVFEDITVAQVVTWLAIICAGWWLLRRIWPGLRAAMKLTDILGQLPHFMEETRATLALQDKKIAEIHHETHTNSGTSIKDAVDRVEGSVTSIHGKIDSIELRVVGIEDTTDSLAASDAELRVKHAALRHDFEHTHPRATIQQTHHTPNGEPQ